MDEGSYYERPDVRELLKIFENPVAPRKVTQRQFDYYDKELRAFAKLKWHEIEHGEYSNYLMDLAYVELQQDLFDYLFPALLAMWSDGLYARINQPNAEVDFYFALWKGNCLATMMPHERRVKVHQFMTCHLVNAIDTSLPSHEAPVSGMDDSASHSFFLDSFNALGQSVAIIEDAWNSLADVRTAGRARFWLLFASGLCFKEDQVPWIEPWTGDKGGGGVYLLSSHASIYVQGYEPVNLDFMRRTLDLKRLESLLQESMLAQIEPFEVERLKTCQGRIESVTSYVERKIQWFLENLGEPNLGGVLEEF